MPDYRRAYVPGGTFFFTVVSYGRRAILADDAAMDLLQRSFELAMCRYPFRIEALVVLPDHLHAIWALPAGDADFSTRWKLVKAAFSRQYQGSAGPVSESLRRKGEKGIWQRRFWEHAIRDEQDFARHCDYIHYNPVKHGLVDSPAEWRHSTFCDFVGEGIYVPDWGRSPIERLRGMGLG